MREEKVRPNANAKVGGKVERERERERERDSNTKK